MKKRLLDYKKKRAISPLIATILLVVVAVILVSLILSWSKFFSNESLEKIDTVRLTKSDAELFIYSEGLVNGFIKFRYSPNENFGDFEIKTYTIISNNGEYKGSVDPSHALREGLNAIKLNGFYDHGINAQEKVSVILETTDKFLTIKNTTVSFTEEYVDLPWVMYGGRKLYIQPSGSDNTNGSGTIDKTFSWEDAQKYCEDLGSQNAHGYADWYLPTIEQWAAIYFYKNTFHEKRGVGDVSNYASRPGDDFVNSIENSTNLVTFVSVLYWSSSSYSADRAYSMYMDYGFMNDDDKYDPYFVRCVRDP